MASSVEQRESEWGQLWATAMELTHGFRFRKIDAARNAGEPDWRMTTPAGVRLVEAKAIIPRGRWAYTPKQLRADQVLTMNEVASVCAFACLVVILSPKGYVLISWDDAQRPMDRREFNRLMTEYE